MGETLRMAQVGCDALREAQSGSDSGESAFISFRIFCVGVAAETAGPPSIPLANFPGQIMGPPELRRNRRQPDCRGLPLKAPASSPPTRRAQEV